MLENTVLVTWSMQWFMNKCILTVVQKCIWGVIEQSVENWNGWKDEYLELHLYTWSLLVASVVLLVLQPRWMKKGLNCVYDKRNIHVVICDRYILYRLTKAWWRQWVFAIIIEPQGFRNDHLEAIYCDLLQYWSNHL